MPRPSKRLAAVPSSAASSAASGEAVASPPAAVAIVLSKRRADHDAFVAAAARARPAPHGFAIARMPVPLPRDDEDAGHYDYDAQVDAMFAAARAAGPGATVVLDHFCSEFLTLETLRRRARGLGADTPLFLYVLDDDWNLQPTELAAFTLVAQRGGGEDMGGFVRALV